VEVCGAAVGESVAGDAVVCAVAVVGPDPLVSGVCGEVPGEAACADEPLRNGDFGLGPCADRV
jgi:hypothetical protein